MTRDVHVDYGSGRVTDRSRAPGWVATDEPPDPVGDVAHGIDLTPSHVGIAGAGLTYGDLTPSGTVFSSATGQVIEGLDVTGTIFVQHQDVTVRNCRITRPEGYNYGLYVTADGDGATIEFVEVWGGDSACFYLLAAADLYRCAGWEAIDSVKVQTNQTLTECYFDRHRADNPEAPGAHLDVCQSQGGSNVTMRRCYLRLNDYLGTGGPNGCLQWGANFADIDNYTAEDCYFWGDPRGAYAVRITQKEGQPTSAPDFITVTGCLWEDGSWGSGPINVDVGNGWVWTGNETTTGTPINVST